MHLLLNGNMQLCASKTFCQHFCLVCRTLFYCISGVARCLTYGGSRNRVLHDPESQFRETLSKDAYQNDSTKSTTIHHFYEKLLKLKDLMKTAVNILNSCRLTHILEEIPAQ